jgi:class 3 adenylate cyclase
MLVFRFVDPEGEILYQSNEYAKVDDLLDAIDYIKKSAGWVAFNILDSEIRSHSVEIPPNHRETNETDDYHRILNKELQRINKTLSSLMLKNAELELEKSREIIKELAVMFLDLTGFSKMKESERQKKVDMLRAFGSMLLPNAGGMYVNTWGDAIVAGFEKINEGIVCACKFIQHLSIENIGVRIGMSFGKATVDYNPLTDRMDINGDSINVGARLETMAEENEVLISKELYEHPDLKRESFTINSRERSLKKAVSSFSAGTKIECYSVELK